MKVIEPYVEFAEPIDGDAILKHLEMCGRVCYKSEQKIAEGSAEKFLANIIKRGHETVLEHYSFTVRFVCDRGVSHEIVRHRLASYCQESQRYCNYGKDQFGGDVTFIKPLFFDEGTPVYRIWERSCQNAETAYFDLLNEGCSPQEARTVLPNSVKTELVMTANVREWRAVLKLRCSQAAHPSMRELMIGLLKKLHDSIPVLFDDLYEEYIND